MLLQYMYLKTNHYKNNDVFPLQCSSIDHRYYIIYFLGEIFTKKFVQSITHLQLFPLR